MEWQCEYSYSHNFRIYTSYDVVSLVKFPPASLKDTLSTRNPRDVLTCEVNEVLEVVDVSVFPLSYVVRLVVT